LKISLEPNLYHTFGLIPEDSNFDMSKSFSRQDVTINKKRIILKRTGRNKQNRNEFFDDYSRDVTIDQNNTSDAANVELAQKDINDGIEYEIVSNVLGFNPPMNYFNKILKEKLFSQQRKIERKKLENIWKKNEAERHRAYEEELKLLHALEIEQEQIRQNINHELALAQQELFQQELKRERMRIKKDLRQKLAQEQQELQQKLAQEQKKLQQRLVSMTITQKRHLEIEIDLLERDQKKEKLQIDQNEYI